MAERPQAHQAGRLAWYSKSSLPPLAPHDILSPAEHEEYSAMSSGARREEFLQGRWALKRLLSAALETAAGGAEPELRQIVIPRLSSGALGPLRHPDGHALYPSVSHSRNYLAAACSRYPLGVDIEQTRPVDCLSVARRFFTASEVVQLEALKTDFERMRAFLQIWTLKEAFVKCEQSALARVLGRVGFQPGQQEQGRVLFRLVLPQDAGTGKAYEAFCCWPASDVCVGLVQAGIWPIHL